MFLMSTLRVKVISKIWSMVLKFFGAVYVYGYNLLSNKNLSVHVECLLGLCGSIYP